ncbi:MAG: efflux RND transporter permease subunit [Firmicutes bacterium]|nr:efflux RND transporter permease subunit [Bacillota bacterium]
MNLTNFSIKRPAGITMIVLFFVVLGIYSYSRIGVELFPAINTPMITVQVSYPGAGAEEVEKQVLKPLEDGLSSTSMLTRMQSTASQGQGSIMLEFDLAANVDQVSLDVSKKVSSLRGRLPDSAGEPVVVKRDINAMPVMFLGISSPYSRVDTYNTVNEVFKDRLQQVPGVADVSAFGGRQKEIAVEVDREKLLFYNVALNSIISKIDAENATSPSGRLHREKDYDLRVMGEYQSLSEIENLPINSASGGTVPLKNLATVTEQIRTSLNASRLNGQDSVMMQISKQSDASVVDVGDALRAEIEQIRKEFPDYDIYIANDQSKYVHQSLNNTQESILEGIITTAIVLLFFLKEWRSMLTVLIAIPTSLIATLFAMYIAGFTFNMMSLMGMALCIGILVDDSIVVLENIHRHLHMGKPAKKAALEGRMEIGTAAIAITLCDVVVFLPIAFMSGMVGQFFRQFGLSVVFATLFSLFVSFTVTPMLSSKLFQGGVMEPKMKFWHRLDDFGGWVLNKYEKILLKSLKYPKSIMIGALILFIASIGLLKYNVVGQEFMPNSDSGYFSVNLELPIGTPFATTDANAVKIEEFIKTIPEVDNYQTRAGDNSASINVQLRDKSTRDRTIWQITDQVRNWTRTEITAGTTRVNESSMVMGMPGGGGGGGSGLQIEILGADNDKLVDISNQVMEILRTTPGAKDINTNWRVGQPEIQATIDRERARYYNVSLADITRTLQTGISGSTAAQFVEEGRDIDINVRFKDGDKISPAELKLIPVYSNGQTVALGNLVTFSEGAGPRTIRRVDRQRSITVNCNLTDRPMQEVRSEVESKIKAQGFDPTYSIRLAGQAQNFDTTIKDMLFALGLSITLVYMVLVVLYESFLTPFIRMFSLPLGFIGAFIALAVTGNSINVFSMMGFIMMDGLVAKNGTLLLDYTLTLIGRGKPPLEAIIEAGKTRLRPIMMTSFTMICGMLPTALALAEGSESRKGMAWVLIGGLLTSTFFTLVVIPIVFMGIHKFRARKGKEVVYRTNLSDEL